MISLAKIRLPPSKATSFYAEKIQFHFTFLCSVFIMIVVLFLKCLFRFIQTFDEMKQFLYNVKRNTFKFHEDLMISNANSLECYN